LSPTNEPSDESSTVRGRFGPGGDNPRAAPPTLQAVGPHQPFDLAAEHVEAFAAQLVPHRAGAVEPAAELWVEVHPLDLDQHLGDPKCCLRGRAVAGGVEPARGPVLGEYMADRLGHGRSLSSAMN